MSLVRRFAFAFLLTTLCSPVLGQITAIGDVNPNPPVNGSSVAVGTSSPGSLTIDDGVNLAIDELAIGAGSFGQVTATGLGTALDVNGSIIVGGSNSGNSGGFGRLTVADGAAVTTQQDLFLSTNGQQSLTIVTGIGSTLTVNGTLDDGFSGGSSRLEVVDGGVVFVRDNAILGGDFNVSGLGSLLAIGPFAGIGFNLTGSLRVGEGGVVSDSSFDNSFVRPEGRVELVGGTLNTSRLDNLGLIRGGGRLSNLGQIFSNRGRIEVLGEDELLIDTSEPNSSFGLQNTGAITIVGGVLELSGVLSNEPTNSQSAGTITLNDGQLRVASVFGFIDINNRALLSSTGGTNDLFGDVLNNAGGQIAVTNDSTLIFHDTVLNEGEISVLPGSTTVFLSGIDSQSGTFQANLAGTDDDTGFGTAEVIGEALLGTIDVAALDGFEPAAGDSFTLLTASSVAGAPTLGDVPELPGGLAFELNVGPTALTLDVVAALPGDFNANGLVDAADYVTLRDGPGQPSAADFQTLVDSFGGGADGSLAATSIPEPSTLPLLAAGAIALIRCRR